MAEKMSGADAQAERTRKAGAFDIRNFIGMLIGIFGVVLLIASIFDSAADIAKADIYDPVVKENFRSFLGAPLLVREQVIGVVHVETVEHGDFSDADLELITLVAERAASGA